MFRVNNECILCQSCIGSCPESFQEIDGKIEIIKQPEDSSIKDICPVGAIEEV